MTKKTLGETRKTIWVFGKPQSMWIPMMNPKYLTENNLWDDRAGYTKKKGLNNLKLRGTTCSS